jgi:uncharacterized protein YjdB
VLLNLNDADKTAQLTALVSPADAIEGATWKSSDCKIAKVSSAAGDRPEEGSVTITATRVDGSG